MRGHLATIDGAPARVKPTRSLADAVISVCLTSHFSREEVRRSAAIVERLGTIARGVRVVVSGGLEMALVASGRLDAFVSVKSDAVSHATGMALIRAAGGRVTGLEGEDSGLDDLVKVASGATIHDELLTVLRDVLK